MSDLRAYEKEELYNGCWTELHPFIDFNYYTVGSNITFHCLDPVNLTGTVAVIEPQHGLGDRRSHACVESTGDCEDVASTNRGRAVDFDAAARRRTP